MFLFSVLTVRIASCRSVIPLMNNECNTEMLQEDMFGIPEVKRLKIREDILSTLQDADLGEDGKKALEGYKTLAKIIKRAD